MTNDEIYMECNSLFDEIKKATERLEQIRKECPHEETFEGLYSWRVGNIQKAVMCKCCKQFIKYVD